jgi:hypothetical protein
MLLISAVSVSGRVHQPTSSKISRFKRYSDFGPLVMIQGRIGRRSAAMRTMTDFDCLLAGTFQNNPILEYSLEYLKETVKILATSHFQASTLIIRFGAKSLVIPTSHLGRRGVSPTCCGARPCAMQG